MKELSDVTFCVVDSGLFLPLAFCLAEQAKRVIYWNRDARSFPSVKQACIGDGFDNIDVHNSPFLPNPDEVDAFVFPDVGSADLQKQLIEMDKPVWGSRYGDSLELDREYLMEVLKDVGLDVPKFEVVEGWTELCKHLMDKEDKYVKISRFRGDMETTHWRSYALDEQWLYWLATNFGSVKEQIRFLVFDSIETDLEIGGDTYCVDGKWPSLMLNGLEWKDKSYFSAVTKHEDMPEQIQEIIEAIGPVLKGYNYRNQISFEDRVKGDKHYYIDATQRGGMPSSGSQQLVWENFPDIIWHGANGELLEPEPAAKFTIECMITSKCKDLWDEVEIDPKLLPWARFSSCCFVDGKFCFPPDEFHDGELGWLVALGDTPTEVLDRIKELADLLPDGLNADVEALAGVIQEIDKAKEEGIPFTDKDVPEPSSVL
jgi:hypothetical protein